MIVLIAYKKIDKIFIFCGNLTRLTRRVLSIIKLCGFGRPGAKCSNETKVNSNKW